jgi:hypothetical protein
VGSEEWTPTNLHTQPDRHTAPTGARPDDQDPVWEPLYPPTPPDRNYRGGARPDINLPEAALPTHRRQLKKYGEAGFAVLQSGRIRYDDPIEDAKTPGEMFGRRRVREWDPQTGQKRTWFETVDWQGRMRIIRSQDEGPKVHYLFDRFGNYEGTR